MTDASPETGESEEWRKSEYPRWAVLDPAGEPKDEVFSTVYVADELIIDYDRLQADGDADPFGALETLASDAGWAISLEALEDPWFNPETNSLEPREEVSQSRRVRLTIAAGTGKLAETPDAWQLLRQARANGIAKGVSLNHVLTTDSIGVNPFKANPFKANPFKANPFKANAATVGIDSYAIPGFGGLQPVTYLGPKPSRKQSESIGRRPVIAILDTGCGSHAWFRPDVLIPAVMPNGEPIGKSNPATDPEIHPSLAVPLDGIFDDSAGHGTFIAGIVLQECGDAQIMPVRVADGEGIILEHELIGALDRLARLIRDPSSVGVDKIDVVNLSFSYYHETPDDPNTVSRLKALLDEIEGLGCVVTCSAGNEATDRPTFPAAFPVAVPGRHVSVGALNPSDRSVALFSNIGEWVKVYASGVSVVSTLPETFNGGVQAGTRDDKHGRRRKTLDADDFRGGFGVWSGTSFAAPIVAGLVATKILAGEDPDAAAKTVIAKLKTRDRSRLP